MKAFFSPEPQNIENPCHTHVFRVSNSFNLLNLSFTKSVKNCKILLTHGPDDKATVKANCRDACTRLKKMKTLPRNKTPKTPCHTYLFPIDSILLNPKLILSPISIRSLSRSGHFDPVKNNCIQF